MRKSRRKALVAIGVGLLLLGSVFYIAFGDAVWFWSDNQTNNSSIEKRKVVFISKSTDSAFWQSAYAGANAASAEYNLNLTCEGPGSEEDFEMQNHMIDAAIEEDVDAIIFSAIDFEANADAINRAAEKGIKIVIVDSPVNSAQVMCYIGTDNYGAGCVAGEEALKNPARTLRIGIVNFDKNTQNGQMRENGFRDTVEKDERTEIVSSINVKSTVEDAKQGTIDMLNQYPHINVLVTFNEWTSLGVGYAVEEMGLGSDTQLIAFDSNVKSVGMLENGDVDALIVQNPYAIGYLGVEKACALLNGQKLDKTEIETSSILVTRENMYDDKSQRALFAFGKGEDQIV